MYVNKIYREFNFNKKREQESKLLSIILRNLN